MKTPCALLILSLCALPVAARDTIDRQLEADPTSEVSISVTNGTIKIVGWDEPKVSVQGTRNGEAGEFSVDRDGRSIDIDDSAYDHDGPAAESNLTIQVPRGSSVDVDIISGRVEVQGINGEIEVGAVSGDVNVVADSPRISLESVSGDVTVSNAGALTRGSFTSVSGDVVVDGALAEGADLELESVSGDITLSVRGELNARIDVETGPGGAIRNGLSADKPEREHYSGSETLSLRLGPGSADVRASVVTGSVTLEKK